MANSEQTADKSLEEQYVRSSEACLSKWANMTESRDSVEFVTTKDGWDLALISYRPESAGPSTQKHPVILCHGLGSNRLAFDLDPQYSLPKWLVAQGFDVFMIELRGHGLSEKPKQRDKQWDWGYNEYNEIDLPVLIERVLEKTNAESAHFIGHSMGGILLYTYLASGGKGIKSGIAVGSSLNYHNEPSLFHAITPLVGLTKFIPRIPIYAPAVASAWMSSTAGKFLGEKIGKRFIDKSLVSPSNVTLDIFKKVGGTCLHPVSNQVLLQMANAINGKGMCNSNGDRYEDLLKKNGYSAPVLSISGEGDIQCKPKLASRYGTDHLAYGPSYGHKNPYGHHDLLVGVNAEKEVWPDIKDWLVKHD